MIRKWFEISLKCTTNNTSKQFLHMPSQKNSYRIILFHHFVCIMQLFMTVQ